MKTWPQKIQPILFAGMLSFILSFQSLLTGQTFTMQVPDAEKGVYLKSVDVSVEVLGTFAVTTTELIFHNPNARQLEGTLEFPLLEGQSVIRFAMEINGSLREAVPVEKEKGQQVFEAIERRRVDPGLLEKTQGNHYRARIFPLLPQADKRVIFSTLEDLSRQKENPVYRLPLHYGKLGKLAIRIAMKAIEQGPEIQVNGLTGMKFDAWAKDWVSEASASDILAEGLVEIALPQGLAPKALLQTLDGNTYFYLPLELPESTAAEVEAPSRVTLIWDSSSSAATQDFAKVETFLDQFFRTYADLDVELLRVRDVVEDCLHFSVKHSDWSALRQELKNTIYDGATLSGYGLQQQPTDLTLLFSDGLQNWGGASAGGGTKANRLYSVISSVSADPASLRALARKNGGELIHLLHMSASEAVDLIRFPQAKVQQLDYHPQQLSQLTLETGSVLQRGAGIAGVLRSDEADLRCTILMPDGKVHSETYSIKKAPQSDLQSELPARIWAGKRIETLELEAEKNLQEIRRIGKAFGIVTKGTSLIILETVEDYAQYEILPPEDLRAAYLKLLQQNVDDRLGKSQRHLDEVYRMWEAEKQWYAKDWPKDKPVPLKQEKKLRTHALGGLRANYAEAPMREEAAMSESDDVYEVNAFSVAADGEENGAGNGGAIDASDSLPPPAMRAIESPEAATQSATIALQPWKPDSAYAEQIAKQQGEACYRTYLEFKPEYASSTAFYLDVFDILRDKGLPNLALRVLSNLAEMQLENHSLLRILGARLLQVDEAFLALPVFETVLRLRPEEPQSYRDLALVNQQLGNQQAAVEAYWHIISQTWDSRFPEIEVIALQELNALLATSVQQLDFTNVDARFIESMPLDLRVVLTWDADNTDIDLWVTDPNGETCIYNNPLTYQGGKMSRDFTRGYGPEVFSLKAAKPGVYKVEANYYGNSQQMLSGSTTLQLNLQTRFGTHEMEEKTLTLRLKDKKDVVFVGTFEVK